MSKNTKQNSQAAKLSPEAYIKKKARTLPIEKCYLNRNWFSSGHASIVVARRHTNGNFTIGIYLVDTFCEGVKDSYYIFNMSKLDFEEFLNEKFGYDEYKKEEFDPENFTPDYALVHNIIWGAVAFAEELGIKSCKEFLVSQYILEEDNEDIEFIDIPFGLYNKPYIIYSDEKPHTHLIKKVKSVKKENEYYYVHIFEIENKEAREYLDYFDENNKIYYCYSYEEIHKFISKETEPPQDFFELYIQTLYQEIVEKNKKENPSYYKDEEDIIASINIDHKISDDIPDFKNIDEYEDKIWEDMHVTNKKNLKTLAKEVNSKIKRGKRSKIYYYVLGNIYSDLGKTKKSYQIFEILIKDYPEFFTGRLVYLKILIENESYDEIIEHIGNKYNLHTLCPERESFTEAEIADFYCILAKYYLSKDKILVGETFFKHAKKFYPSNEDVEYLKLVLNLKKGMSMPQNIKERKNEIKLPMHSE